MDTHYVTLYIFCLYLCSVYLCRQWQDSRYADLSTLDRFMIFLPPYNVFCAIAWTYTGLPERWYQSHA